MITLQLTSPYGDEQEIILNWLFTVYIFQSTPPYGDELFRQDSTQQKDDFNPHPRMGMNFYVYHSPCTSFIKTHAPYGDEPSAMEAPLKAVSLQPTPPYGDEPRFA